MLISDLLLALPNACNYVASFTLKEDILLVLTSAVLHRKNILDKGNKIRNKNYMYIK